MNSHQLSFEAIDIAAARAMIEPHHRDIFAEGARWARAQYEVAEAQESATDWLLIQWLEIQQLKKDTYEHCGLCLPGDPCKTHSA